MSLESAHLKLQTGRFLIPRHFERDFTRDADPLSRIAENLARDGNLVVFCNWTQRDVSAIQQPYHEEGLRLQVDWCWERRQRYLDEGLGGISWETATIVYMHETPDGLELRTEDFAGQPEPGTLKKQLVFRLDQEQLHLSNIDAIIHES